jgi:hypothetical protein
VLGQTARRAERKTCPKVCSLKNEAAKTEKDSPASHKLVIPEKSIVQYSVAQFLVLLGGEQADNLVGDPGRAG